MLIAREAEVFKDLLGTEDPNYPIVLGQHGQPENGSVDLLRHNLEQFARVVNENDRPFASLTIASARVPIEIDGKEGENKKYFRILDRQPQNKKFLNIDCVELLIGDGDISIENCKILNLEFYNTDKNIVLRNCKIGRLKIEGGLNCNLVFSDTLICELTIGSDFKCRDIKLDNVQFSTKPLSKRKKMSDADLKNRAPRLDRASYANLHRWANDAGNSAVAHMSRGCDLGVEHAESKGFERAVLNMWWLFGDYGLSPMRTVGWLAGIFLFMVLLLYFSGTTVIGTGKELVGWKLSLVDPEPSASDTLFTSTNLHRSFWGAIESAVSPFSILSPRKIIAPNSLLGAAAQFIHGIASLALFVLLGFSVRRRFKMN